MNIRYEVKTEQNKDNKNLLEDPIFDFFIDKFLLIFLILIIFLWKTYGKSHMEHVEKILLKQKYERDKIRSYLSRILAIANADRVIYGEFYNGDTYASGDPKIKFAVREEVKEEGIASIKNLLQNIPGESFDYEIEEFSKKKYLIFLREDERKQLYRDFLERNNLAQILDILVTNNNGRIIGIISIHFLSLTKENNAEKLDSASMNKILAYKSRIEFILNKKRNKSSIFSIWKNIR